MNITVTNLESDISTIHEIMLQSFSEYKYDDIPSSALMETTHSIKDAFNNGECALIAYQENKAIGMLRFQTEQTDLYFYRLSVIPAYQGQGIARKLVECVIENAKKSNKKLIADCSYARIVLERQNRK